MKVTSTAREISNELKTPFDTTAKIMQVLKQADILTSIQGVKGGYSISKPLSEVNYLEFTKLVGENSTELECLNGCCQMEASCNISTPMKKLNHSLTEFFTKLSLKELLS